MNQRFKEIVEELKKQRKVYSYADFARIVDIQRGDLSQMMSGKRKVSKRCVSNMLANFPEINEKWLCLGEGEMFISPSYSHDSSPTVQADDHSTAIAGNKNVVNADQTIAMLVAEVAAQRKVTEKVLEQNSELLALVAGKAIKTEGV